MRRRCVLFALVLASIFGCAPTEREAKDRIVEAHLRKIEAEAASAEAQAAIFAAEAAEAAANRAGLRHLQEKP